MSKQERIQLNLRLDGHKELYEALKVAASDQDTSVNQFVINALKAALGWKAAPSPQQVGVLEERLASLEERLAALEQQPGKLQKSA